MQEHEESQKTAEASDGDACSRLGRAPSTDCRLEAPDGRIIRVGAAVDASEVIVRLETAPQLKKPPRN